MHSFLVLLPLTLIAAALAWLIVASPPVVEYVAYISTIEAQAEGGRLSWQIAVHVLAYAITCFVLVAAARTISGPVLPERSTAVCRLQRILEVLFVAVPSAALAALMVRATIEGMTQVNGAPSRLLSLAAVVAVAGLVASAVAVAFVRHPLEFFRSRFRPFSIKVVDIVGGLAVVATVAAAVLLAREPVEGASFLGIFPVLFLASSVVLIVLAWIFKQGSSPVGILSGLVAGIVILHAIDQLLPSREFRHSSEMPKGLEPKPGEEPSARDIAGARNIPGLRDGFAQWLGHRRVAIEAYRAKNKAYPVFIVAAQGGGMYAAYHSALTLARLYDQCPEFAHHVFAVSGVSGGSLGAAVFTELVRSMPDPEPGSAGCTPRTGGVELEHKVTAFFDANFLAPVVNSALLFDAPTFLVPWLRLGPDRALALEYAFESAWSKLGAGKRAGLAESFYGRWDPKGAAPALFLATTGVNSGIPVLVSQIRWSRNPRFKPRRRGKSDSTEAEELLQRMASQDERSRNSAVANILDFRPDLQLATSTAVALSARFPYVTPPGNIRRRQDFRPTGLHEAIEVLELLDGGFFDNSGAWVAIDMLEDLERYVWGRRRSKEFEEFAGDLKFHLIRFTDRPAQRHGGKSERQNFELASPLVAFNNVRLARGAQLRALGTLKRTEDEFVYLSDAWLQPPVSWVLSKETRLAIEVRSGAEVPGSEECCRVYRVGADSQPKRRRREYILEAVWEEADRLINSQPGWKAEKFVPDNRDTLKGLRELVETGDERAPG